MYDDQDRPPWLRNLRPPRSQPETELYASAPTVAEPAFEPGIAEASDEATGLQDALTRQQLLLLALLLWGNVSVLGCLCLLATRIVVP